MAEPTNTSSELYPIVNGAATGSADNLDRIDERPDDAACAECGEEVEPTKHPSGNGWMQPTDLCSRCDYLAWRSEWIESDKREKYERSVRAADIPDRAWSDAHSDEIELLPVLEAMCGVAPGERRDLSSAFIFGDVGTGKSVQCAKALKRYIERWVLGEGRITTKVRYCNPSRLLERYKASFDGAPAPDTDTLITCDFLILDDVGAEKGSPGEKGSDWARGELYNIINGRFEERKLTLFTSNYALTEEDQRAMERVTGAPAELLEDHYNYSRRTVSRIFQMCGGSQERLTTIHLKTNWRKPRGRK